MGNDIKTKHLLPLISEDMDVDFLPIPFSLVGEVLKSRLLEAIKHPQLILAGAGKTTIITAKEALAPAILKNNTNLKYHRSYK